MTLIVLMLGLFLLIYLEKPLLFSKKEFDYIFLVGYLILLTIYIINTSFYRIMSDEILLVVTLIFMLPIFSKIFTVKAV
ncbi:MAG: hypothetical protein RR642_02940 [Solibacillus sp.]